jgi:hypothetical protein
MPTGSGTRLRLGQVLVVTSDDDVREHLLRLAETVGIQVGVIGTPLAAGAYYRSSPLVLAGADQAGACLRAGMPPCGEVVVVADASHEPYPEVPLPQLVVLRPPETVRVVTLPADERWLLARLREELPI